MSTFMMGEDVMYDGERYVIWGVSEDEPRRVRLLATGKTGAKIVWALPEKLEPMTRYTTAKHDTERY